jgi:MerR family copper efflux transcriptional regulator
MKIGEFAKTAGVSTSKVRFYESRGLLLSAPREDNGYRNYGPEDLKRLLRIKRAQTLGFSLDQIAGFFELAADKQEAKHGVVEAAEAKLSEIDRHLSDVQARRKQIVTFLEEMRGRKRRPS